MTTAASSESTDLPDLPTIDEAFAAAVKQHSAPAGAEHAAAADELGSQPGDEDDEDPAEPAKGDAAPVAAATADTKGTKAKPAADSPGILSEAEYGALKTKHANDPDALFHDLNKAFTTSSQKRAERLRLADTLEPYADIIEAFEHDTAATLRELAEANGFTLTKKGEVVAGDPKPAAADTKDAVAEALGQFQSSLTEALGPELDYLGEPLAKALLPAVKGLVEKLAASTVETSIQPLKAHQQQILSQQADDATDAVMSDLEKKFPDYKDHEEAMVALSRKVQPVEGMTEIEYLEHLYHAVTRDGWEKNKDRLIADAVKKHMAKLSKGAGDEGTTRERSTPDEQVEAGTDEAVDFDTAWDRAVASHTRR